VVAALLALAALVWPLARQRFIYPGGELPPELADPALHGLTRSEQVWLEAEDGVEIHAWWTPAAPGDDAATAGGAAAPAGGASPYPATGTTRGVVIYCHGNAESMATRAWIADRLSRLGLDVLLFDYRGYGLSQGRPSEEGLARDARAAWQYVVEKRAVALNRVVIMGHSLGSAVAARLALSVDPAPAGLVVGSPFPDMPALFARHAPWLPDWMLRWKIDRHEAGSRLAELQAPLLVMIGTDDAVIPPELSFEVLNVAAGPSTLVSVSAGHDTVMGHPEVWDALGVFLEDALRP
jgi:pimeloyl-ACP methyl ester carboxylesterase